MENLQHQSVASERRVMSRIDAALRINYQIISDDVALNDPYDANFVLPRYFLLLTELDQFDQVIHNELKQLNEKGNCREIFVSTFKKLFKFFHFGLNYHLTIGLVLVVGIVILMVVFGFIKFSQQF